MALWTGGYSGRDHCRGAWAQVYQVVLCCLVQNLNENEKKKGIMVSKVLNIISSELK